MLRHEALDDEVADRGIEPHRQPIEGHFPHRLAHAGNVVRIVRDLVIGNQEIAVILPLQLHPVLECTYIVAQMKRPGRTDSGQDTLERLDHGMMPPSADRSGAHQGWWRAADAGPAYSDGSTTR
jgi:hypothetical protein